MVWLLIGVVLAVVGAALMTHEDEDRQTAWEAFVRAEERRKGRKA